MVDSWAAVVPVKFQRNGSAVLYFFVPDSYYSPVMGDGKVFTPNTVSAHVFNCGAVLQPAQEFEVRATICVCVLYVRKISKKRSISGFMKEVSQCQWCSTCMHWLLDNN